MAATDFRPYTALFWAIPFPIPKVLTYVGKGPAARIAF